MERKPWEKEILVLMEYTVISMISPDGLFTCSEWKLPKLHPSHFASYKCVKICEEAKQDAQEQKKPNIIDRW